MLTWPTLTLVPCLALNPCHTGANVWHVPHIGDMISTTQSSSASKVRLEVADVQRARRTRGTRLAGAMSAMRASKTRNGKRDIVRRTRGGRVCVRRSDVKSDVPTVSTCVVETISSF